VVQVFLDFWLEYTEEQLGTSQLSTSYLATIPRRVSFFAKVKCEVKYGRQLFFFRFP